MTPPPPFLAYGWAWLESGVEDGGTWMPFVEVRRNPRRIALGCGSADEEATG